MPPLDAARLNLPRLRQFRFVPAADFRAQTVDHKNPNGGGQVLIASLGVDTPDQFLNRDRFPLGNLPQDLPEWRFQRDAGAVARNGDGTLEDSVASA